MISLRMILASLSGTMVLRRRRYPARYCGESRSAVCPVFRWPQKVKLTENGQKVDRTIIVYHSEYSTPCRRDSGAEMTAKPVEKRIEYGDGIIEENLLRGIRIKL